MIKLQKTIKRILKEDKDYTKLLKSIIDSSDVFNYKHFCGFDIITPGERSDQYNFLNKNKIPYLIKVYFVGGPNSEVWPRTQAIQNKELDLMMDLREYITSLAPFNIQIMSSHVNSCEGYDRLMKRKYSTDDLQESIRRILKEETNSKREGMLNILKDVGLYDFTRMTGLKYMDIVFDVGELPRDVKIQYLKDVISDLQQIPDELDLTFLTGSIPLYENDDWQMVYAGFISNEDDILKVHTYIVSEEGYEDDYDVIFENDLDNETLDILVTELSEKLQHKRDTRI